MPKATTEGGATNAWEPPLTCAECSAQVAPGAPRCPECPSTEFTGPEAAKPFFEQLADVEDAVAEANAGLAAEDPADPEPEQVTQLPEGDAEAPAEPQAPDAAPEPAPEPPVPPRTPPRRA